MRGMRLLAFVAFSGLFCAHVHAGKIFLSSRYVRTTYTLHLLTGATSDEKAKNITVLSPLEITKFTEDGADYLRFRALKKGDADQSEEHEAKIEYSRKEKLVEALGSLQERNRGHDRKPEDAVNTLFEEGDIKLICERSKRPKKLFFELRVEDRIFVINDAGDLRKLLGLLVSL